VILARSTSSIAAGRAPACRPRPAAPALASCCWPEAELLWLSASTGAAVSMRRVSSVASHVLHSAPTAAEVQAAVAEEEQDAHLGSLLQDSWPMFDASSPIDDAFVQRFLTEGFLTMAPDIPASTIEHIAERLRELTPPVVLSEEAGEALEKTVVEGAERGYLVMDSSGKVTSADGKRTNEYDNSSEPVLPELDELLEAPNVRRTLRALLGDRYMVDSDRGSNFTVPGRCATTDWHRDGNDKRRHHHPRMLMGLYYPQAVTLKMGPTAIVARSQWLSDFDPGYQHHEVLATPRQSTAGVNNCGDYLGTGRGGAREPMMSTVPQHFGRPRYMAVPAGTLMIMCVRSQSARRTHRTATQRTALLGHLTAHRPAPALISVRPT
jgi:hypothetical protein